MDIQNQPTTPAQTPEAAQSPAQAPAQAPAQNKPKRVMRNSLIVFAMLLMSAVGYMSYKNPTLFSASLTGGTDQAVDTDLYISNTYKAQAGDSVYIDVKAGKAMINLNALKVTFVAPLSQIEMVTVNRDGTVLKDCTPTTNPSGTGEFTVDWTFPGPIATVKDNDILFKILVTMKSTLNQGDTIVISRADNITKSSIITGNPPSAARVPTFTDGKITIGTAADACKTMNVGEHGACDQTTGTLVCFKGYDPKYLCNACITGVTGQPDYTGYPDCKVDVLSGVNTIVLTFSNDTISKLTVPDRASAYSSAYVFINSSAAAAKTITLEGGAPITLLAVPVGTEVEKITALTNDLKTKLEAVSGVNVTKVATAIGLLKLTASAGNADSSLDGITTNSGDLIIVPGLDNKIIINPASSYQARIIGKRDDGSAMEINFNNVKWQPQPVNRLDSAALNGGLLEKGDKSGTAPLYAQIERATGAKTDSNQITVEIPSGSIVEYIHIIGSKPLERGGRVTLSTKISDVNQIADIKDIRTSIVRSAQATYAGINGDAAAVWFTATPVISEVATSASGTQQAPAEGGQQGSGAPATPPPVTENYRIYTIPVEIPQDENMTNGDYKLVLQITDTAGHVAASVLQIKIGAVATGDVNSDGKVNMLDVISAFQIANGSNATPTQSELQAADIDNNGKVTMLDVITLFNQLK